MACGLVGMVCLMAYRITDPIDAKQAEKSSRIQRRKLLQFGITFDKLFDQLQPPVQFNISAL